MTAQFVTHEDYMIHIKQKTFASHSLKLIQLLRSFGHYPYIGTCYNEKPDNFTGIAVVLHLFTRQQHLKYNYMFSTYCFIKAPQLQTIKVSEIEPKAHNVLVDMTKLSLETVYFADKELFNKIVSATFKHWNELLLNVHVLIDYYFYNNDMFIGAYRFGYYDTHITRLPKHLSEFADDIDSNDNIQLLKLFIDVMFEDGINFAIKDFIQDDMYVKRTQNSVTYKFLDKLYYDIKEPTDKRTSAHFLSYEINDNKLIFSIGYPSYASMLDSFIIDYTTELSSIIAPRFISTFKIHMHDDYASIETDDVSVNKSLFLVESPDVVLCYALPMLCNNADLVIGAGNYSMTVDSDTDGFKIVPISYDELIDIDNGVALSQYNKFLDMYAKHGYSLYQRLLLSTEALFMSVNVNDNPPEVKGIAFGRELYVSVQATNISDSISWLGYKMFKGKLVNIIDRDVDTYKVQVDSPTVYLQLVSPYTLRARPRVRCTLFAPWHIFYAMDSVYMSELPDVFKPRQLSLINDTCYVNDVYFEEHKLETSCEARQMLTLGLTTVPVEIQIVPDKEFVFNFETEQLFEDNDILSTDEFAYSDYLLILVLSSFSFDASIERSNILCHDDINSQPVALYTEKYTVYKDIYDGLAVMYFRRLLIPFDVISKCLLATR